jgi:hypothetical protein
VKRCHRDQRDRSIGRPVLMRIRQRGANGRAQEQDTKQILGVTSVARYSEQGLPRQADTIR